MKPLPKPEDPAAVLERPTAPRRVHAWACARCGDDRKTETPPPTPRLCPRCAARTLEMHTEPATPKRYGDDDEDDGAPLELPPAWRSSAPPPIAREHVQADTPAPAPACPNGEPAAPTATAEEEGDGRVRGVRGGHGGALPELQGRDVPEMRRRERERVVHGVRGRSREGRDGGRAEEDQAEGRSSVTAEEGEKGMGKVETKGASALPCDWPGCDYKANGPQALGRHKRAIHGVVGTSASAQKWAAREAAKITAPKPSAAYKCEVCGEGFPSGSALGGHRNTHTSAKAKREAVETGEGQGEFLIHEAVMRAFPEKAGKIEGPADYAAAIRDMSFALKEAREAAAVIPAPEPPSLRCLVVRVRGAVPLEVECATPEDAAAFVRLVSAGGSRA